MEESSEGFKWPKEAHGLESRQSCTLLHPSFNEETYVRRRCSDNGKWLPLDVTQCAFKEPTGFAVVIVVATVAASEEEIKQQEGTLKNQVGLEQEPHTNLILGRKRAVFTCGYNLGNQ